MKPKMMKPRTIKRDKPEDQQARLPAREQPVEDIKPEEHEPDPISEDPLEDVLFGLTVTDSVSCDMTIKTQRGRNKRVITKRIDRAQLAAIRKRADEAERQWAYHAGEGYTEGEDDPGFPKEETQ